MKRLRKIIIRGSVVAGAVLLTGVLLCVVWELSPTWRTRTLLRDARFSPLPPGAKYVTHTYIGPLGPVGFLKYGLGSLTINISFEASQAGISAFVSNSPIMREPRTEKTADGFKGEIDSMTSWNLSVNEQGTKVWLTITDHFD